MYVPVALLLEDEVLLDEAGCVVQHSYSETKDRIHLSQAVIIITKTISIVALI